MADLTVRRLGRSFANPIVLASGPAGFGLELAETYNLAKVGALATKTVTIEPRQGNPQPRLVDAPAGVVNSIGLQNPGFETFRRDILPAIRRFDTRRIVSIAGRTGEELGEMAAGLDGADGVDWLELNLSCPNVRGETVADHPDGVRRGVACARAATSTPILVKLPGESGFLGLVEAALDAGAEGVALINAIRAMRIHTGTGQPFLAQEFGGLCGPAILPIALARVFEARRAFPEAVIVGTGGVSDVRSAVEMLCAGADLVGIGFGVMADPGRVFGLAEALNDWMEERGLLSIEELIGAAHRGGIRVH